MFVDSHKEYTRWEHYATFDQTAPKSRSTFEYSQTILNPFALYFWFFLCPSVWPKQFRTKGFHAELFEYLGNSVLLAWQAGNLVDWQWISLVISLIPIIGESTVRIKSLVFFLLTVHKEATCQIHCQVASLSCYQNWIS